MTKKCLYNKWLMPKKFKSREYNRCHICGRRRGYIRKFGICRICFRSMAHQGVLPGVTKSSW